MILVMALIQGMLAVEDNMLTFVVYCAEESWDLGSWAGNLLVDVISVSMFLGTLIWGPLADVIGRMHVLWITMTCMVVFGLLSAIAPTFPIFVFLRALCGFFEGAWVVSITYAIEVLPVNFRGSEANYIHFAWGLGTEVVCVCAWLVIPTYGWRTYIVIVTGLFVLGLPIMYTLVESPRWLVDAGRRKEAMEALQRMAKANGTDLPCRSLIAEFSEEAPGPEEAPLHGQEEAPLHGAKELSFRSVLTKSAVNYCRLFDTENLMNTLIMSLASVLVVMSYSATSFYDNDVLLGTAGVCSYHYKETSILASSELVGLFVVQPFLDRPTIPLLGGRRGSIQFSVFVSIVPIVLSGYSMRGQYLWAYIARAGILAAYNVILILLTEMFSTSHRVTATSFATLVSYLGLALACAYIYSDLKGATMMWITAVATLVLGFLTCFFPETAQTELS
jgi:MFS family permease